MKDVASYKCSKPETREKLATIAINDLFRLDKSLVIGIDEVKTWSSGVNERARAFSHALSPQGIKEIRILLRKFITKPTKQTLQSVTHAE